MGQSLPGSAQTEATELRTQGHRRQPPLTAILQMMSDQTATQVRLQLWSLPVSHCSGDHTSGGLLSDLQLFDCSGEGATGVVSQ